MEKDDKMLVILGVIAIIAIVGLILLFNKAITGQGIYAQVGTDVYGEGTPVYSDNCEALYGQKYIFTQNPQTWRSDCHPGIRTETWQRAGAGPYPWYENPMIYEINGWCCPFGA